MSLFTNAKADAGNQRFYLAVVDDTGAEQLAYGRVEIKLQEISGILAATTPTPVDGSTGNDPGNIKFREVQVCLDDGSQAYAIVLMGGFYKKA